jgi:hypothetical protein
MYTKLLFVMYRWNHYDHNILRLPDPILALEADKGVVSYVFQYVSHDPTKKIQPPPPPPISSFISSSQQQVE